MSKGKIIVLVLLIILGTMFAGCTNKAATQDTISTINAQLDDFVLSSNGSVLNAEYGIMKDGETPYFLYTVGDIWAYADSTQLESLGDILYNYTSKIVKDKIGNVDFGIVIGDSYGNAYIVYLPGEDTPTLQ